MTSINHSSSHRSRLPDHHTTTRNIFSQATSHKGVPVMPQPVVHEHHYHYHDNRDAIHVNANFGSQGGYLRISETELPTEEHTDSQRERQRLLDRIHRHIREDEEVFGDIRELPSYPSIFERDGRLIEDVSSHRSRSSHTERAHSRAGSHHSRAEQGVQQVIVPGPDGIPRIASIAPSRAATVRSSGSRAREAPPSVAPSRASSVRPGSSRTSTLRPSDSQARHAPSRSSSTSRHSSRQTLFDAEVRPEDSVSQAGSRASRVSSAARSRASSSHSRSHSHHTPSQAGSSHESQYYRDPANPNVRYHSSAHSRPGR